VGIVRPTTKDSDVPSASRRKRLALESASSENRPRHVPGRPRLSRPLRAIIPLALGAGLWLIPTPSGLSANAWSYFALFATVIVALITEPLPGPVVGILGITTAATMRLVAPAPDDALRWALSGFSHSTVWLIFVAFMFGRGYDRTGLGRRIALILVRVLGRRTLGLGYAVALADLALAPFTPSNTARTGGTIYPIIKNIPALYASDPGPTARRIGAYLMWTAFAVSGVTSSMFLTANAANLFAVSLMKDTAGISIGWAEWAVGFLPVGLTLFLSLPAVVYVVYPPEVKVSARVPAWAARELTTMGGISHRELTMAGITSFALGLWIFGGSWFNPTTTALAAFCLMLLTRVLRWRDVLGYADAWRVFVWFATLVTLADGLGRTGFLGWFAAQAAAGLPRASVPTMLALFVAVFFVAHYMFASLTAHATALLPVFLAAGSAVPGLPPRPLALLLCYAIGLMGVLTPYATGPAPIFFGSGYVTRTAFWALGTVFGAFFLLVFLALGIPWLLLLSAR
jgi:L-tartrate/succinate antiporter